MRNQRMTRIRISPAFQIFNAAQQDELSSSTHAMRHRCLRNTAPIHAEAWTRCVLWCGRPDLNWHEAFAPTDFKSAQEIANYLILLALFLFFWASVLANVLNQLFLPDSRKF